MRRVVLAGLAVAFAVGCGGQSETPSTPAATPAEATTTVAATGCTAGGLDAMAALSDFELELDQAQKDGKITTDQLLATRNELFETTQAALAKEDWPAYCKAIDDTQAELGL